MRRFISDHRDELLARCHSKSTKRSRRPTTDEQLTDGVPLFLEQLTSTLQAESEGKDAESIKVSGPSGGDAGCLSEIGRGASRHGKQLREMGFTVNEVVHAYGDICQSITELAHELGQAFGIEQYKTLNRCLDNAIADAVTSFGALQVVDVAQKLSAAEVERLTALVYAQRSALYTATLAFDALESGHLPVTGATGMVLKRALASMAGPLDRALAEVRSRAGVAQPRIFSLNSFISDAADTASLHSAAKGCPLHVSAVDLTLEIAGNRETLSDALGEMLQSAFGLARQSDTVSLSAHTDEDAILIEVHLRSAETLEGSIETKERLDCVRTPDQVALGLGLSTAQRHIEAEGGQMTVRDVPGQGRIYTLRVPRDRLQ